MTVIYNSFTDSTALNIDAVVPSTNSSICTNKMHAAALIMPSLDTAPLSQLQLKDFSPSTFSILVGSSRTHNRTACHLGSLLDSGHTECWTVEDLTTPSPNWQGLHW